MAAFGTALKNLKIGLRVQVIVAIPLLVAAVLAGQAVLNKNAVVESATRIEALVQLAESSSLLVHELQKERGMSAAFIGSTGQNFAKELPQQREATDKRLGSLQQRLRSMDTAGIGAGFKKRADAATAALKQLSQARQGVISLNSSVPQMAKYYTATIAGLIAIPEEMHHLTDDTEILSGVSAYTAFLQGKERAGIERAMGAGGFGAGKFSPAVYQRFVKLTAMQDTFMSRFMLSANPADRAVYTAALASPEFAEVEKLRKIAIDSPANGTQGVTAQQWFDAITRKIDVLKSVEDTVAKSLIGQASDLRASAQEALMTLMIAIAAIFAVTILAAWSIIRSIVKPVSRLTEITDALAEGSNDVEIDLDESRDEVGQLVGSVKIFKEKLAENDRLQEEQRQA